MTKREQMELDTLKMFKQINASSERIEKAIKTEQEKKGFGKVFLGFYFFICTFGTIDLLMMIVNRFF